MAARALLLVCLWIANSESAFPQDLVWDSPPGNAVRYEIRIQDKSRSQVRKFAGERTLDFTLVLRFAERHDEVIPILCTVERYATTEKDQQGFVLTLDTNKKPDEETEFFHKTAVELCGRLYPIGMESNVSLVRFREFSTDTMESRTLAEQFSNDLKLALSLALPPLDGGSNRKPHAWTVNDEWEELQTAVPLTIEHRLTSTEGLDPAPLSQGGLAKVTFRGGGEAKQGEDATAYTAKVAVEGEYGFECGKHFDGRTLRSLKSTETLTTNDAFKSARMRTVTVQLASRKPESKFSPREKEFLTGAKDRQFTPFHTRTLTRKIDGRAGAKEGAGKPQ